MNLDKICVCMRMGGSDLGNGEVTNYGINVLCVPSEGDNLWLDANEFVKRFPHYETYLHLALMQDDFIDIEIS